MIRSSRIGIVHLALALFALALLGKTAHLQLVEGDRWESLATRQQVERPPPQATDLGDETRRVADLLRGRSVVLIGGVRFALRADYDIVEAEPDSVLDRTPARPPRAG